MHALHQRNIRWQSLWQRDPSGNKFGCGIRQVQLIENAFIMIGRKHRPVFLPEHFALGKQTTKIRTIGKPVCRHLLSRFPHLASFIQTRLRHHPAQHNTQLVHTPADRKQGRILYVGTLRQADTSLHSPFHNGTPHEKCRLLIRISLERIIETVRTRHPSFITERHDIDTDTGRDMQFPVVHRNPRYHMPIGKYPSFTYKTVFDP